MTGIEIHGLNRYSKKTLALALGFLLKTTPTQLLDHIELRVQRADKLAKLEEMQREAERIKAKSQHTSYDQRRIERMRAEARELMSEIEELSHRIAQQPDIDLVIEANTNEESNEQHS
jgi:Skp family chaperone for outer membrane proteins